MEAHAISRRALLQGAIAKGAEYTLEHHPAARALRHFAESEFPYELRIIQTGIDQIEADGQGYQVQANPDAISDLTRYIAQTENPPVPQSSIDKQFQSEPLHLHITSRIKLFPIGVLIPPSGLFTSPSEDNNYSAPKITLTTRVLEDLLDEQNCRQDPERISIIPHELKHFVQWRVDPHHQRATSIHNAKMIALALSTAAGVASGITVAERHEGNTRDKIIKGCDIGGRAAMATLLSSFVILGDDYHDPSFDGFQHRLRSEPELYDLTTRSFDFQLIE